MFDFSKKHGQEDRGTTIFNKKYLSYQLVTRFVVWGDANWTRNIVPFQMPMMDQENQSAILGA